MKFKFNRRKLTFRRFTYYLLIATIVISCITNGIFAKFTTESDGGDNARVADFGVVVSISGDLFSTAYNVNTENEIKDGDTVLLESVDSNKPTIVTADGKTISVKATSNADGSHDNVVAPGTKNEVGINVSVTGTPETDYSLTYSLSNFQTVALYGGTGGLTYGLMVPFEKGVVNESNFTELVEAGIYTSDNGDNYQTYTKVLEEALFDEDADYFKLKDTVTFAPSQIYMPIKYYITDNTTNTKESLNESYKIPIMWDMSLFESFDNNTFDGCGNPGFCIGHIGEVTGTQIYNTGVNVNENFNITWEWPYHQVASGHEDYDWCNACDTILGYIAAGKNVVKSNEIEGPYDNNILTSDVDYNIASDVCNYNLDIIFNYSITIDQVD